MVYSGATWIVSPTIGSKGATGATGSGATGPTGATGATGALPLTTPFTLNGLVYASSTSALATGSALTFDGANLTAVGSLIAQRTGGVSQYARISNTGGTATFISDNQASSAYTGFVFQGLSTASGTPVDYLNLTSSSLYTASGINVGIGTSSPTTRLTISGTETINTATDATAGLVVKTFGTAGGIQPIANFQRSDSAINLQIGYNGGNGDSFFGTTTNHNLYFLTNNTERMRINSSGKVGIGTGSPDVGLSVGGAGTVGGNAYYGKLSVYGGGDENSFSQTRNEVIRIGRADISGNYYHSIWSATGSGSDSAHWLRFYLSKADGSSQTMTMQLDANGNVGIGTTGPVSLLQVVGNSSNQGTGTTDSSYLATFDSYSTASSAIRLRQNGSNSYSSTWTSGTGGAGIYSTQSVFGIGVSSNVNVNNANGPTTIFNSRGLNNGPYLTYTGGASNGTQSGVWCYGSNIITPDGSGVVTLIRNGIYGQVSGSTTTILEFTLNYGWNGGWFEIEVYSNGYFATSVYRKYVVGGGYTMSVTEVTNVEYGFAAGFASLNFTRTGSFANGTRSTPQGTTDNSYCRYQIDLVLGAYVSAFVVVRTIPGYTFQADDTNSSGQIKFM
jgi:hypothetical protein